jgi:hypothetical protein
MGAFNSDKDTKPKWRAFPAINTVFTLPKPSRLLVPVRAPTDVNCSRLYILVATEAQNINDAR